MDVSRELQQQCTGSILRPTGVGHLVAISDVSVQCVEPDSGKLYSELSSHMCPSCKPACAVAGAAPGGGPSPSPGDPDRGTGFCVVMGGTGTTMYMDGFTWTFAAPNHPCVSFLFAAWVID